MATGQQAFHGDSKMSTLAAILNQNPSPSANWFRYSTRCGEDHRSLSAQDPSRRFQIMADLKVMLEELKEESDSGTLSGTLRWFGEFWRPGFGRRGDSCRGDSYCWMALSWGPRKRHPHRVVPLTSYAGFEFSPSFSPDGNQVAFS